MQPDSVRTATEPARAGGSLQRTAASLARNAFTPRRETPGGSAAPLPLPSRDAVAEIVELIRGVLFPGYFNGVNWSGDALTAAIGSSLSHIQQELHEQVLRGLCFSCNESQCTSACEQHAAAITSEFLSQLPHIQQLLVKDAIAAYEGDPACTSQYEPVYCYPGMLALTNQRLAHALLRCGAALLPRIITELAHSATGIDIHPGAQIGESFFIDHGTGVVIGETSIIGDNVKLYQGVTLGAKSFPLDADGHPVKGIARHPVVEDNVTIYSGVTILGRVRIGAGSIIGGNVWLTHSVPPGSRIYQAPVRTERFAAGAGI